MESNIIVYHANYKDRCEKFISDRSVLFKKEDGIWLGNGMYFWDNLANARYWKKEKMRKARKGRAVSILRARLSLENLLDLTDDDVCSLMEKIYFDNFVKKTLMPENAPLGKKLNILFDNFKTISDKFYSIKIYGQYHKLGGFFYSSSLPKVSIRPVHYIKCIYSVRNQKCLSELDYVEV